MVRTYEFLLTAALNSDSVTPDPATKYSLKSFVISPKIIFIKGRACRLSAPELLVGQLT